MPHIIDHILVFTDNEVFLNERKNYRIVINKSELQETLYVHVYLTHPDMEQEVKTYEIILMREGEKVGSHTFSTKYLFGNSRKKWYEYDEKIVFSNISFTEGEYEIIALDTTDSCDCKNNSEVGLTDLKIKKEKDKSLKTTLDNLIAKKMATEGQYVVFEKKFVIENLPDDYTQCIRFNSILLACYNPDPHLNFKPQQMFDIKRMEEKGLYMEIIYENVLGRDFKYELTFMLYSENGLKKEGYTKYGIAKKKGRGIRKNCLFWDFGSCSDNYWREGKYRIEVLFLNRLVLVAPFVVGAKDVYGEFDIDQLQPYLKEKNL